MKKNFVYLSFFIALLYSEKSFSQALPPLQPEQDACNAIQLCGSSFFTQSHYTGFGSLLQVTLGNSCVQETACMFIRFQIATPGYVVFNITPNNQYDDYDFAVIDITTASCSNFTAANIIRCNANNNNPGSTPGGIVGLNTTAAVTTVPGGTFGSPFCQQLNVTAGQTFLVMIDWAGNYANPASTASGFTIDFSASTATFVGGAPPLYDTIAASCDYRNGLTVHMTNPVKCSSLQTNGSDFQLSPANATVSTANGGCAIPTATTQSITLTFSNPLPPGIYYLKAKNGTDANTLIGQCNGQQPLTDSIAFRVEDPLTINLGPDTVTCVGNSLQLNAIIGGGPFLSTSIAWSPATYLSSTTIPNPVCTPTADITYTVTITPDGKAACAKTATLNIVVLQGFTLLNHDTTICKGASVQMQNSGDVRYTYTWTPSTYLNNPNIQSPISTPDTTIKYIVTATKVGCTDSSRSITVKVEPVPTVYVGPDLILCYGDTLQMHPTVTPTWFQNYSYSWTPAAAFDAPTTIDPIFFAKDTTHATLIVRTPAGCTDSDSRELIVVPNDFAIVSNDTGMCPPDSVHLNVTGGLTYQWLPKVYISNDTSATPYVHPTTTTTYTVFAKDVNGCLDTQKVTVTVFPEALVNLVDTVLIYYGDSYTMDPRGNCLYFQWFPMLNLSDPFIGNTIAKPDVNTRYFVTAKTEEGCIAKDSIDVIVSYDSYIDVPNAFSPGSAPNALLKPVHLGRAKLNYFRVFDRWGQKVFETNNINDGWDGRINGHPQPMGVYVYIAQGTLPNGKVITKQGNVTLLR